MHGVGYVPKRAWLVGVWVLMLCINAPVYAMQSVELDTILVTAAAEKDDVETSLKQEHLRREHVVDLAEQLSQHSPSTTLIRKSGYGNEIALRGFGKSNLRVLYDNAIIEGACGSRKDPALSHVPLLAVGQVNIQPGPFDVSRQGGLGGAVSVSTVEPRDTESAEVWLKSGSNAYYSGAAQVTGGTDIVQLLAGFATTRMDPYKDGAGRHLTDYAPAGRPYSAHGHSREAFKKQDAWAKVRISPSTSQALTLAHTYGLAEDVLTPRVAVDIEEERTSMTRLEYEAYELGSFSDHFQLRLYHHDVQHEPFDRYRDLVGTALPDFHRRFEARSTFRGAALKNTLQYLWGEISVGFSHDHQDWNANAYNAETNMRINDAFIPDVDHDMWGGYVQVQAHPGAFKLKGGVRYDYSSMEAHDRLKFSEVLSDENTQQDAYLSGYLNATWYVNSWSSVFLGAGRGVRLPTGAERYLQAGAGFYGNPELKPTTNHEIDLGATLEGYWGSGTLKLFYSDLDDYIYQQAAPHKTWTNIDAHIYGFELHWEKQLSTALDLAAGYAWQRGRKDSQPLNNTDRDLSEIPPWKTRVALAYQGSNWEAHIEWLHSGRNSSIDEQAGEVSLDAWDVINITAGYTIAPGWDIHLGIENLLDEYYAVANSYEYDVVSGSDAAVPIVYEPGRLLYLSLIYRW